MKQILIAIFTLTASLSFGHEGHDKTPGAASAPHGGTVKATDNLYLELVSTKNEIKIYPLSHESAAVPTGDLKIEATATLPKKTKGEAVKLAAAGDSFTGSFDAKGAHRYTLDVVVTYRGKKEKTQFNVEPQ